jgi:hypothetical protein
MDQHGSWKIADNCLIGILLSLITLLVLVSYQMEINSWIRDNFVIRAPLVLISLVLMFAFVLWISLTPTYEKKSINTLHRKKKSIFQSSS